MTQALKDTFTGGAGALAGHSSDSGNNTWANLNASQNSAPLQLDGNASVTETAATAATGGAFASWSAPGATVTFLSIIKTYTDGLFQCGPMVYTSNGATTSPIGYTGMMSPYDNTWNILKGQAGAQTTVAQSSHTFGAPETRAVVIQAAPDGTGGVNLALYVDGAQTLSFHDTSSPLTATGNVGLRLYAPSSTTTTGIHVLYAQTDAQASTFTGPSSGSANTASANFTLTMEVGSILGTTVNWSDNGVGGTFSPSSPSTISGAVGSTLGGTTATVQWTPPLNWTGTATISATTTQPVTTVTPSSIAYTVSNSSATGYSFNGPSGGVVNVPSTTYTVALNGLPTGTQHITITPSGGGLSTPIVLTYTGSTTTQTFSITPTVTGPVTLTPVSSPQLGTDQAPLQYTVSFTPTTWTYRSSMSGSGFPTGLTTVGFRVIAHDGSIYSNPPRITSTVSEIFPGSAVYASDVQLPFSGNYHILWDNGQTPPVFAPDERIPDPGTPSGLNLSQVANLLLAANAGKGGQQSGKYIDAGDGASPRIAFVAAGNERISTTLSPPT